MSREIKVSSTKLVIQQRMLDFILSGEKNFFDRIISSMVAQNNKLKRINVQGFLYKGDFFGIKEPGSMYRLDDSLEPAFSDHFEHYKKVTRIDSAYMRHAIQSFFNKTTASIDAKIYFPPGLHKIIEENENLFNNDHFLLQSELEHLKSKNQKGLELIEASLVQNLIL